MVSREVDWSGTWKYQWRESSAKYQPVSDCGRCVLRARDVRSAGEADTVRLGGWAEFGGSAAIAERDDIIKKTNSKARRNR